MHIICGDKMLAETREITREYRSVACLVATASIYTESLNLIDRLAYALNPESAIKSLNDSLRIVEGAVRRGEVGEAVEKSEGGGDRSVIKIRVGDGREYRLLYCSLPNVEVVRRFLEEVRRNIEVARTIGTLANSMVLEARLR